MTDNADLDLFINTIFDSASGSNFFNTQKDLHSAGLADQRSRHDQSALSFWLLDYYKRSAGAEIATDLYPLISTLDKLIRKSNWPILNWFLSSIDYSKFSVTASLAVAHTTYSFRNKIPDWNSVLSRLGNSIDQKGEKATEVLDGFFI